MGIVKHLFGPRVRGRANLAGDIEICPGETQRFLGTLDSQAHPGKICPIRQSKGQRMARKEQTVKVAGHTLKVSNLDKVLYPQTGTTKGEVMDYFQQVAPALLPHAAWRPATRKRWVDGVGTSVDPG